MTASVTHTTEEQWRAFASEVGAELANPLRPDGLRSRLDVLSADWFGPEHDEDEKTIVELCVRTVTGRVLYLDMPLEYGDISDATQDYDEVDGKLVKHEYDLSKPEEVARYFGQEEAV
jgi:hypothetical protein